MAESPESIIATALREAEQKGYERGYAQAESDHGQDGVSEKLAGLLADVVESASTRFRSDPDFARVLKGHADELRGSAAKKNGNGAAPAEAAEATG